MIIGVTEGTCFTTLPMYLGEIASPDIRSFLSSLVMIFYILGTLLINIIGIFSSIWTSSLIIACVPAIHFLGFVSMPESPYFYIKVRKFEQAEQSLKIFLGSTNVHEEMNGLKEAVQLQEGKVDRLKMTDLITIPSNRRALFIFLILSTAYRASARGPLMSYTRFVFEESGSNISSALSTIAYSVVEVVVAMFTTYFIVDHFGKRWLAIISSIGVSVSLLILGLYFYLKDNHAETIDHLNWLPVTALVSSNGFFSVGISFSHMCFLSELFPTNVKINAMCFARYICCNNHDGHN
ncbi:hypothetical protein JTB14_016619 [Gonioctena quinquepunctata]|nr:hypothetical protein JTB14_016619 [Gonioctena quinquepunctata]